jgi:SAM-dependent methyltransferase
LKSLDKNHVEQARKDFNKLFAGISLKDKSFLDIGFGQGIGLFLAASKGANVVGCDINPKCYEAFDNNKRFFPSLDTVNFLTVIGSILSKACIDELQKAIGGKYEVVHSWGVLHHTGNMRKAINNALSLVKPGGYLIISIYNRHWSSLFWKIIKYIYTRLPKVWQKGMVNIFYPLIFIAKLLVVRKNPLHSSRGMDFYFDVMDWIGGFPYEYASKDGLLKIVESYNLELVNFFPPKVPTGCNEFVFKLNN